MATLTGRPSSTWFRHITDLCRQRLADVAGIDFAASSLACSASGKHQQLQGASLHHASPAIFPMRLRDRPRSELSASELDTTTSQTIASTSDHRILALSNPSTLAGSGHSDVIPRHILDCCRARQRSGDQRRRLMASTDAESERCSSDAAIDMAAEQLHDYAFPR